MFKDKIYKWSLIYEIIRWLVRFAYRLFYSEIVIVGKENIPRGVPVIFAPNHQNALMDPMALVCSLNDQIVFLARADIFSGKIARTFLRFLKILPVYRIRDGKDNLANNKYIFDISVETLEHNKKICLMPEGTQNDKHQLRPLVKGIFRIAFQALENNPSVVIIPVGIDYSDYSCYRSQLVVQFGKPIKIADYKEIYLSNPSLAINKLKYCLTDEIKKLMINIECGDAYNIVDNFRKIIRPVSLNKITKTGNKVLDTFYADKWATENCNSKFKHDPSFVNKIILINENVQSKLKKHNLKPNVLLVDLSSYLKIFANFLCLLLFLPVFLFGLIFNSAIIYLPNVINNRIGDKQFHSSIKFAFTFFVFPVYYFLALILVHFFTKNWLISFEFILSAAFCGLFSIFYSTHLKMFIDKFKATKYKIDIKNMLNYLNSVKIWD